MYRVIALLVLLFILNPGNIYSQDKTKIEIYHGTIEYTTGGFGGFLPPAKGDSVYLRFTNDSVFYLNVYNIKLKNGNKYLSIPDSSWKLKIISTYDEIVSPDKTVPTKMKNRLFEYKTNKDTCEFCMRHFGNGSMALLTMIYRHDSLITDIFSARIKIRN